MFMCSPTHNRVLYVEVYIRREWKFGQIRIAEAPGAPKKNGIGSKTEEGLARRANNCINPTAASRLHLDVRCTNKTYNIVSYIR